MEKADEERKSSGQAGVWIRMCLTPTSGRAHMQPGSICNAPTWAGKSLVGPICRVKPWVTLCALAAWVGTGRSSW